MKIRVADGSSNKTLSYRLDHTGSIIDGSRVDLSRLTMELTQPPVKLVLGASPGVKIAEHTYSIYEALRHINIRGHWHP